MARLCLQNGSPHFLQPPLLHSLLPAPCPGPVLRVLSPHAVSLWHPQLFAKLQAVKAEILDVNDEHVKARQELEQTQNELTRELKFK